MSGTARETSPALDPSEPQGHQPRKPQRLSPSRASDWMTCPRKFYYRSVLRLPDPPTPQTARGTAAHQVLEDLLDPDVPAEQRTEATALAMVRSAWEKVRGDQGEYYDLAPPGSENEQALLEFVEAAVRNYFRIEDPARIHPEAREYRLNVDVGGVPLVGVIDRVDVLDGDGTRRVYITDYKTGKIPKPRFHDSAFFGMRVYALMYYEDTGELPHELRLVYLQGQDPSAVLRRTVTWRMIDDTREQLRSIWRAIDRAWREDQWEPRKSALCDWCSYRDICPLFAPEVTGVAPAPAGDHHQAPEDP